MDSLLYSKFNGLDEKGANIIAPQTSFLKLDNFITSHVQDALTKRGGSFFTGLSSGDYWIEGLWGDGYWADGFWGGGYDQPGDCWGIGAYPKKTSDPKAPVYVIPVRHRRDGSTSYIEKYDWDNNTWTAITQGASTSFSIGDIASFSLTDEMLTICAGRPCKLLDITSGSLSRLGGPAPASAPTVAASAGAGALTGDFAYIFTFYDSTTGWESSPSPIKYISLSAKNAEFSSLPTTCDREGVDYKRIYRTIKTQEQPFLYVGAVALATTTYTDNTTDENLGAAAPFYSEGGDNESYYLPNDHDPPPTTSYIVASHQARNWIANGTELYYSAPYDGDTTNLEYYSPDRVLSFPFRITGLAPLPSGSMLVFLPPGFGVWEVIGRDETDFARRLIVPEEGTNFHGSVCAHNNQVAFWGRSGPSLIIDGSLVPDFGAGYAGEIRERLLDEANTSAFAWTVWHDEIGFIFGYATIDTGGILWYDVSTGGPVEWEDAQVGTPVEWEESP